MGAAVAFGGGDVTATMSSITSGKASVVLSEVRVVVMWVMDTRRVPK